MGEVVDAARVKITSLRAANEAWKRAFGDLHDVLERIAEHPGPNACEAAHWRAEAAREALHTSDEEPVS